MATVDNLDIQISSSAQKANDAIDSIIEELERLAGALKIDTSKLSNIGKSIDLSGISNQAKAVSQNLDKMGTKVAQSMKPLQEQTKEASKNISEVAKDFQEKFKDIPVKVDFSKPESELKKFQNQAKNAENALSRIMASSTADKQIGGIERWSIVLAQANNAIEQIQSKLSEETKLNIKINTEEVKSADELIKQMKSHIQQEINGGKRIENPIDVTELTDEQFNLFKKLREEATLSSEKIKESFSEISDASKNVTENLQNLSIDTSGIEEAQQNISRSFEQIDNVKKLFSKTFSDVKSGELFENIAYSVKEYAKQAQIAAGIKVYTEDYKSVLGDIERIEGALEKLEQKQRDLQAAGTSTESKEWQKLTAEIATAEKQLETYIDKMQEMEVRGQDVEFSGGLANQSILKSMGAVAGEAMSSLRQRIAEIPSAISQAAGNIPIIGRVAKEAAFLGKASFDGIKFALSGIAKAAGTAVSAVSKIASAIAKLASGIKSTISKLSSMAKSLIGIKSTSKGVNASFGSGLKTILKYGLGIRSLYILFNKLRSAIKEGFTNLVQYSDETNASVSMLKTSMNQFKNATAAAFSPLLNAIAPILNQLIQLLIKATNAVNQFLSAFFGGTTWIRAKSVYEDVAKGIGKASKAAKGALQPFDKLNNLTTQDNAGAGAASPADMFETLPIEGKYKDLANWIKDMWEKSDFYDLGKLLGEKLKNALDSIPWNKIKATARKIGKILATLINGFIEVKGLGYSIGKTLIEAINTGFEFLNQFVHNLHWESVGKFIADTINGFFQNIDWNLIYDTFVTTAKGLSDLINNFVNTLDWDAIASSVSNSFNTLTDTIYTFITETDWIVLAEKVGKTISDAFTGIDWGKLGETVGETFKAFFNFVATAIENIDWWKVGDSVTKFLVGIDWNGVAEALFKAIGAAIGGLAAFIGGLIAEGIGVAKEYFQGKTEEVGGNIALGILKGLFDSWVGIGKWIYENILTPFIEGFKNAFEIHSPSKVMEGMGEYIMMGLFNGMESFINKIISIFVEIKNGIKTPINGIISFVNGMMSGVSSGINGVINALNKLKIDVPSWVAELTGINSFSFNIPNVSVPQIPMLAKGGIVTQYTPAIIGEAGAEAVLPLTNPKAMKTIADGIMSQYGYQRESEINEYQISGQNDALLRTLIQENRRQNKLLEALLDKEFGITKDDIGRAARDYSQEYYKRNGKYAFT